MGRQRRTGRPDVPCATRLDLFPHGPDCQIGEVVLIPKYSGQAIKLPGQNGEIFTITFINDDEITAGWGDTVVSFADAEPAEPRAPVAADMAAPAATQRRCVLDVRTAQFDRGPCNDRSRRPPSEHDESERDHRGSCLVRPSP